MAEQQSFIAGLKWVAIGRLSAQLISWIGTLYVMRTLAPEDYGLAAICSTIVAMVSMLAEFGIGAGIIQAHALSEEQLRSVYGAALLFGLLGALLMLLTAPLMTAYFRAPEALPLIQISALHLLLAPLATLPDAALRREMAFRVASVVEFLNAIAATIVTVLLAWQGWGSWALIIGPLVGSAVRAACLNLAAPHRLRPSLRLGAASQLIGFGLKVAISRIGSYVFGQSDVFVAGRHLSRTGIGEYSVAMNLAMLPVSKIMNILNTVAYPTIAKMSRDGASVRPVLLTGLRLFAHLLVPCLWGLAALAPWLIETVLGSSWHGAILPLQIVCIALPLRLVSVLLSSVLQGLGHAGLELQNTMTGVLLMLPCFLIGAHYGAVGLACGWLAGLPLMVCINLYRARHALGIGIFDAGRAMAPPLLASLAMAATVTICGIAMGPQAASALGLLLLIVCGIVSQALCLWLVDRQSARILIGAVRRVRHA